MTSYPEMTKKVIFHLLTDRFMTEGAVQNPLAFQGGGYEGVYRVQERGFFQELGVDIIQPSPLYKEVKPQWDLEAQRFDHGAHQYWPDDHYSESSHFGSCRPFLGFLEEHGYQAVIDVVRHVGVGASLYKERPQWFTEPKTWFWNLPELDLAQKEVRDHLFGALKYWNPEGVHAFRWDTLHHLPESYIRQLFSLDESLARYVWSVGEVLDGNPEVLRRYLNMGCPSVYNYPAWFSIAEELSFAKGDLGKVATTFQTMFTTFEACQLVNFTQNHDMDLLRSYALAKGASAKESLDRFKMALNLTFFLPGIPSIYYLDSTGWTGQNFSDPNRSGRYCLQWPAEKGIFFFHLACLSRVRKNTPALWTSEGNYAEVWRPGEQFPDPIFAFERRGKNSVVVLVNNGDSECRISIPVSLTDQEKLIELMAVPQTFVVRDGRLIGSAPARSVLALTSHS